MNKYLDKWPLKLNCRYFDRFAAWTRVAICANSSPKDWYKFEPPAIQNAFFQRLTMIYHVLKRTDDETFDAQTDEARVYLDQLDETHLPPQRFSCY